MSNIPAVKYGRDNESNAIKMLENAISKKVDPSGIWLHFSRILGASPDGLVGGDKIVEVKCLPKYEGRLENALANDKDKTKNILYKITNESYVINKDHVFYHQMQGQLFMTKRNACFLVLYTKQDKPIIWEVLKDMEWENNIDVLINFYFNNYIPYIMNVVNEN